MTSTARPGWWQRRDAVDWTHAVQLGAAVLVAFGLSRLLHLPEGFWAVMSALIVLRPTVGSTLGAGWDRILGTVAGTLVGLAGVWLRHLPGLDTSFTTLVVVALLAATSALAPALRSAPITALIVLGSSGIGDHSALQVAALRAVEIGLGVATGALLSLLGLWQSTARRFDAACAALLRQIAAQVRADLADQQPSPQSHEAAADALRVGVRALAVQAVGADREARLAARLRRRPRHGDPVHTARIASRTLQDAALLGRIAALRAEGGAVGELAALGAVVADALERAAACRIAQRAMPADDLRDLVRRAVAAGAGAPWVQPVMRLLAQDLATLTRR